MFDTTDSLFKAKVIQLLLSKHKYWSRMSLSPQTELRLILGLYVWCSMKL